MRLVNEDAYRKKLERIRLEGEGVVGTYDEGYADGVDDAIKLLKESVSGAQKEDCGTPFINVGVNDDGAYEVYIRGNRDEIIEMAALTIINAAIRARVDPEVFQEVLCSGAKDALEDIRDELERRALYGD